MSADPTNKFGRYHNAIITRHVYLENNQVFLKGEKQNDSVQEHHGEIWYPVNFQWIPVVELENALIHQSISNTI